MASTILWENTSSNIIKAALRLLYYLKPLGFQKFNQSPLNDCETSLEMTIKRGTYVTNIIKRH